MYVVNIDSNLINTAAFILIVYTGNLILYIIDEGYYCIILFSGFYNIMYMLQNSFYNFVKSFTTQN